MPTDPLVAGIDEELARLRQIRSILHPLLSFSKLPKRRPTVSAQVREAPPEAAVTAIASAPVLEPAVTRIPPRKLRTPRLRVPKPAEQPTALKGFIPRAPVVVWPTPSKTSEPVPTSLAAAEPGSFAALVRAAEQGLHAV